MKNHSEPMSRRVAIVGYDVVLPAVEEIHAQDSPEFTAFLKRLKKTLELIADVQQEHIEFNAKDSDEWQKLEDIVYNDEETNAIIHSADRGVGFGGKRVGYFDELITFKCVVGTAAKFTRMQKAEA